MSINESRGQLAKAMKNLLLHWQETRASWDDVAARRFEERYIRALEKDLRGAAGAMDQMQVLLQQIHRDCE